MISHLPTPLITFLLGCLTLAGWLLATRADDVAIELFRKSLWSLLLFPVLISIPLALLYLVLEFTFADAVGPLVMHFVAMALLVAFEEAIKLGATRSEVNGIRAFALVSLFGIYELALSKPIDVWDEVASGLEMFWLQAILLPAVSMHILTAAIYAFHFRQKPVVQFAVCAAIHLFFNLAAYQFEVIGDAIWLMSIIPLAGMTWWLLPNRRSSDRGPWQLAKGEPEESE